MVARSGGASQQLSHGRHGLAQAIHATVLARATLVFLQGLDVGCNFHLRALVVTARVLGQNGATVQNANPVRTGQHGEAAPHMGVGDRVVVQIETHIGCLARMDLHAFFQRVGVWRHSHQAWALVVECRAHRQLGTFGPRSI